MAESITEGTLKQWLKQKGDYVEADEEVATIETDKVRCTLPRTYTSSSLERPSLLPRIAPHYPTSTAADFLHSLRPRSYANADTHRLTSRSTRPKPAS